MLETSRLQPDDPFDAVFKTPTPQCKSYQSAPPKLVSSQSEDVQLFSFQFDNYLADFFEPTSFIEESIITLRRLES